MTHNLRNVPGTGTIHRDYGATSSTGTGSTTNLIHNSGSGSINPLPEVNFSGFSPTEFVSLSETIAHNIGAINSHSRQLEKILKVLGTQRDQPTVRERVHSINQKCNNRINMTSMDLQGLADIVKRGDKQQKLQLERLSNEFCEVVEKYGTLQKRVVTVAKQSAPHPTQFHMQVENGEDEKSPESELNQQLQQQQQMQFQHDLLVDREQHIKQIESEVLDVNSIMRTISTLMRGQGEDLERIETSVEIVASEIEGGREELAKATARRQSYRRKMLILLAIAVIIGLIVTGFVVSKFLS